MSDGSKDGTSTTAADGGDSTKADTTGTPSGGRTASEYRKTADSLRTRVDVFGKTIAGIATAGTTALGLTKGRELFPSGGETAWVVIACVALAAAVLAAIGVAARLMKVAGPAFIDDDLENNDDLDQLEKEEVKPVFEGAANRYGYTSIVALRGRERSLRDAASKTLDKDERARRLALADDVKTEIEQALARSQVVVVRRRASNAVTDSLAWALYVVVIAGVILFAAGTDKVSSARPTNRIAEAKACGDARNAGATAKELGDTKLCQAQKKGSAAAEATQPSAEAAKAQVVTKLAAAWEACAAFVGNGAPDCASVRTAIVTMTKP